MLTYCSKCKKNTKNMDAKMMKTKNLLYVAVKNQNL